MYTAGGFRDKDWLAGKVTAGEFPEDSKRYPHSAAPAANPRNTISLSKAGTKTSPELKFNLISIQIRSYADYSFIHLSDA